jgi:hypothetical protein
MYNKTDLRLLDFEGMDTGGAMQGKLLWLFRDWHHYCQVAKLWPDTRLYFFQSQCMD